MIAAATTSLPETPGGERNWDYRYCWVRDSTFMLWGLHSLGFEWEANDYFYFMQDVAQADDLQVMYGIQGERELIEDTLDHLSGYDNARPVRIGNGAYNQRQHDVWGTMLDSIFLHAKSRDHLPERRWPLIERLVEAAIENWKLPDRGIWEVRGEDKHFVSSKVMCWVACDRGARLARLREAHEHAERWQAHADEIKADIIEHGCKDGVFTQHYETDALDASALLIPLVRFLPPEDERVRKTVLAIADNLTIDGLVLRYKVEETDDGLVGRGGHVHDLLVLARQRAERDRRALAGPRPVPEAARLRVTAAPVRGGDRPAQRPPPGQLPAGVHAPGADQRRDARDPRRREARRGHPAAVGAEPDRAGPHARRRFKRKRRRRKTPA